MPTWDKRKAHYHAARAAAIRLAPAGVEVTLSSAVQVLQDGGAYVEAQIFVSEPEILAQLQRRTEGREPE